MNVVASRRAAYLPAVLWMVMIFTLSSREKFPSAGGLSDRVAPIAAHLFLYGVLSGLLLLATIFRGRMTFKTALGIVVVSTLYGVIDEYHQSFVPGRDSSLFDVIVDAIGSSIVVAMYLLVPQWLRSLR